MSNLLDNLMPNDLTPDELAMLAQVEARYREAVYQADRTHNEAHARADVDKEAELWAALREINKSRADRPAVHYNNQATAQMGQNVVDGIARVFRGGGRGTSFEHD